MDDVTRDETTEKTNPLAPPLLRPRDFTEAASTLEGNTKDTITPIMESGIHRFIRESIDQAKQNFTPSRATPVSAASKSILPAAPTGNIPPPVSVQPVPAATSIAPPPPLVAPVASTAPKTAPTPSAAAAKAQPSIFLRQARGAMTMPRTETINEIDPATGKPASRIVQDVVPAGVSSQRVDQGQIPDTAAGQLFRKDIANMGDKPNVKASFDATTGRSVVISDPLNRAGGIQGQKPLEGQARANLLDRVGGGGVLRSDQNEVDLLSRMRREGAPGSRGTFDVQRQNAGTVGTAEERNRYVEAGRQIADDQTARQTSLIGAQGKAARGVEAERTAGATAERDAARTYRQTEQEARRDERRSEIEERGRIQAEMKKDSALDKATSESARRSDAMFKEAEIRAEKGDGLGALPQMIDIANASAADKNLDPNIKDYYVLRANTIAQEQARMLAPKLTGEKLVALRNALLKFKGDVNAPEVKALIASGK